MEQSWSGNPIAGVECGGEGRGSQEGNLVDGWDGKVSNTEVVTGLVVAADQVLLFWNCENSGVPSAMWTNRMALNDPMQVAPSASISACVLVFCPAFLEISLPFNVYRLSGFVVPCCRQPAAR